MVETKIMKAEELGVEINKEFILRNVTKCVYNAADYHSTNSEEDNFVSTPCLDLGAYYRVRIDDEKSFKVRANLMDAFGITMDELMENADMNTRAKISVQNLGAILFGHEDNLTPDVVSNTEMLHGAGCIGYKDLFADLCREHGAEKCFVLPSSVHEILVHYPNENYKPIKEDFDNMVREVNCSQVAPEERLADHCYVYDLATDTIEY